MAVKDIAKHFRVPTLSQVSPLFLAWFSVSLLDNPGVVASYFTDQHPGLYNPIFGGLLCGFCALFLLFVNRSPSALYICNIPLLFHVLCTGLYVLETHSAAQGAILQSGYLLAVILDVYHSTSAPVSS